MEIIKKLYRILTGWRNYFWPRPEIEDMAKHRMLRCSGCVHLFASGEPDLFTGRYEFECNVCGCNVMAKTRVKEEECPIGKW